MNRTAALVFPSVILAMASAACAGGNPLGASPDAGGDVRKPPTPGKVPSRFVPGDCNLEEPAFCETFEEPEGGGRGGEINDAEWSFARFGHLQTRFFFRVEANSSEPDLRYSNTPTFCGKEFDAVVPPLDVRLCDGTDAEGHLSKQLNEVFHDDGGFSVNSMRIRQPFDFTDRTGTIVYDVDAKLNPHFDGHGWWTELWITEDPAPIPYHGAPTMGATPRRGVGFQFAPSAQPCFEPGFAEVGRGIVTKNYDFVRDEAIGNDCIKIADGKLNRFKVLINKDTVEFWASDAGDIGSMRQVAKMTDLDLDFTVGYIHLQHAHYNAHKADDASASQTYRWDNVGFDGPARVTPRGYDIADELDDFGDVEGKTTGYYLGANGQSTPQHFEFQGVDLTDAVRATLNFNLFSRAGRAYSYRFNGKEPKTFEVPQALDGDSVKALTLEVPLAELVDGTNTLDIELANDADFHEVIGNIDLTIDPSK